MTWTVESGPWNNPHRFGLHTILFGGDTDAAIAALTAAMNGSNADLAGVGTRLVLADAGGDFTSDLAFSTSLTAGVSSALLVRMENQVADLFARADGDVGAAFSGGDGISPYLVGIDHSADRFTMAYSAFGTGDFFQSNGTDVWLPTLAGVGSRHVLVDANGKLSAA